MAYRKSMFAPLTEIDGDRFSLEAESPLSAPPLRTAFDP